MFSMFRRMMMALFAACALAGLSAGCGGSYRNDAEKKFLDAAKKGDAEAQYNLGACYEFGGGAEKNVDRAKEWYRKAAAKGHKKAQERLLALNPPKAPSAEELKQYRIAAGKGDAEALFQLGQCREFGYHGDKDPDAALRCYDRAAAKGHEKAKERAEALAAKLAPAEAEMKKYYADARKGNAEAQYQIGRCFELGFHKNPRKPNFSAARNWYKKAADQGHPKAVERLNPKRPAKKPARKPKKPVRKK
jgi:hypothetical protein